MACHMYVSLILLGNQYSRTAGLYRWRSLFPTSCFRSGSSYTTVHIYLITISSYVNEPRRIDEFHMKKVSLPSLHYLTTSLPPWLYRERERKQDKPSSTWTFSALHSQRAPRSLLALSTRMMTMWRPTARRGEHYMISWYHDIIIKFSSAWCACQ
jgi:hypothetical protein